MGQIERISTHINTTPMAPQNETFNQAAAQSRKKRRLNHVASKAASTHVSLDELVWREVPFPDSFEDAEGFFGLEEISDVEIARVGDTVAFRQSAAEARDIENETTHDQSKQARKKKTLKVSKVDSEDEWSGFDDASPNLIGHDNAGNKSKDVRTERPKVAAVDSEDDSDVTGFEALRGLVETTGDVSQWQDFGLSQTALSSLQRMDFTIPTLIQRAAIPEILTGHDVIGKAPTGSGKTLAFGIPIMEAIITQKLKRRDEAVMKDEQRVLGPTALIISPTRELAHQISKHLESLSPGNPRVSLATLTGGLSLHKQQRLIAHADVVIATPGRLWEILNADSNFRNELRRIQFLVLDEADRLLSVGHFKDLGEILSAIEPNGGNGESGDHDQQSQVARQTLIFSATFHRGLQQKLNSKGKRAVNDLLDKDDAMEYLLQRLKFREERPKFIDVNPDSQMAEKITERILECAALEKDLYLYAVLLHLSGLRTLIFLNSIAAVRRLVPFLQNLNIQAQALHSEMPQKARLRSVERFSSASSPSSILVATDVAARGLDIPSVEFIIHYHVPRTADMYVHRSGRTARAQMSGLSVLLCSPDEVQGVRRLVAKVHATIAEEHRKRFLSTIELDTKVIARIKPRVNLSKKISDATTAKERHDHEDNWLRNAAEELGVDYDSEEFSSMQGSQKGRGKGRKDREKEARSISKDQLAGLRSQLKMELKTRINAGVSERYLTAGGLDVDDLIAEGTQGKFLGKLDIDGL